MADRGVLEKDPELKNAIYAVGVHYPGPERRCGPGGAASRSGRAKIMRDGPSQALSWTKTQPGLAKLSNLNYINARITKTTICYLIGSYYDSLSFAKCAAPQGQ